MSVVSSPAFENVVEDFTAASGVKVRSQLGSKCTTFSIGGELSALVEPESFEELQRAVQTLASIGVAYRILGNGSNLLISDSGISDFVIRLGRGFRFCNPIGGGIFEIGGATSLMTLSRELSDLGWSGIEFAGGIPASLGGAVKMNAGAHGRDLAAVLCDVTFCTRAGEIETVKASELNFSYRHSDLPEGSVVIKASIKLVKTNPLECSSKRAKYLAERKLRQPLTMPSAGSIFKNPTPTFTAGKLIESAGLKGSSVGGAQVSQLHGNWIVNPERSAKASDVMSLIAICQKEVLEKDRISIHPELVLWE